MTIKKQFTEIHDLLKANEGKKLGKTLMAELIELMSAKGNARTFRLDDAGNVTHIFCYYHKEWEEVSKVPYGAKKSTSHGYNTMCKEGISNWTKQQRKLKLAREQLLQMLTDDEITVEELPEFQKQIEAEAKVIIPLGEKQ